MSPRWRFWGSALAVALAFALATALWLPYEALQLEGPEQRGRAWLLTLWTAGVMSVLFGVAGLLGGGIGVREVVEAGSVAGALEERRRAQGHPGGGFAAWLVATGGLLIAVYFVAWAVLTGGQGT